MFSDRGFNSSSENLMSELKKVISSDPESSVTDEIIFKKGDALTIEKLTYNFSQYLKNRKYESLLNTINRMAEINTSNDNIRGMIDGGVLNTMNQLFSIFLSNPTDNENGISLSDITALALKLLVSLSDDVNIQEIMLFQEGSFPILTNLKAFDDEIGRNASSLIRKLKRNVKYKDFKKTSKLSTKKDKKISRMEQYIFKKSPSMKTRKNEIRPKTPNRSTRFPLPERSLSDSSVREIDPPPKIASSKKPVTSSQNLPPLESSSAEDSRPRSFSTSDMVALLSFKIRCSWDEDKRYIFVEKDISPRSLMAKIEAKYDTDFTNKLLKFKDEEDELITITCKEDISLCLQNTPADIFICNKFHIPLNTNSPSLSSSPVSSTRSSLRHHGKRAITPLSTSNERGEAKSSRRKTAPRKITTESRSHTLANDSPVRVQRDPKGSPKPKLPPFEDSSPFGRERVHSTGPHRSPPVSDCYVIGAGDLDVSPSYPTLGVGYFGNVSVGFWRGAKVACKTIFEKSFRNLSEAEMWQREVSLLSTLRHPNVLTFYGICIEKKDKIIVTELMEGGSLFQYLRNASSWNLDLLLKIATDTALGMDYLHQNNILHRDLTTKNILLTADFHAKLADFGLSKKKLEDSSGSNTMGSVPWMAPEVLTNPKSFNRKSDVYSYAICLWEMFTGAQNLLDTEKSMVVLAQEVIRGWRPEIPRTCPAQWGELIQRCWCPEAAERLDFYSVVGVLKSRAFACEVVMMVGSEYVTGLDFGDS